MSDSVQPHRRQPTRLPRPWDSPGKNTGVGCHFLLQCMRGLLLLTPFLNRRLLRPSPRNLLSTVWDHQPPLPWAPFLRILDVPTTAPGPSAPRFLAQDSETSLLRNPFLVFVSFTGLARLHTTLPPKPSFIQIYSFSL